MKKILAVFISSLAIGAGPALASDLPMVAPVSAEAIDLSYDWTGFYLGINGGYGAGTLNFTSAPIVRTDTFDINGWLGGVTAGYNAQMGQFVLGVEGDIDAANIHGTGHPLDPSATPAIANFNINWLGTVRGRAGFAADNVLIYATGGLAVGGLNGGAVSVEQPGDDRTTSGTQVGWTVGSGIEVGVTETISLKAEYLYVDLGTSNYSLPPGAGGTIPLTADVHPIANIARVGLNFRF
jgi:outer membrane immunogenic protein